MIKRLVVATIATLAGIGCLTSCVHSASKFAPGVLLVKFKPGTPESAKAALHRQNASRVVSEIPEIGVVEVTAPRGSELGHAKRYQASKLIDFAEPDYTFSPADVTPNDPWYANWQPHLKKIGCPAAWGVTTGNPAVVIAILDTGVDSTHPDLVDKITPGWNAFDNNMDVSDVLDHGTSVAGTAAACSNNGLGVASIAWNCRIMPIRVSDAAGYGDATAMARGLIWAADQGVRLANISYYVSESSTVSSAAQYFQTGGGMLTTSAGNSGYLRTAADNPYMVTVSATDSNDAIYSWSNTGNNIDIAAPGFGYSTIRGGGYGSVGGTSISAPVVAGVAALVMSANSNLTVAQVVDILEQSADDLGSPGWDVQYGWGRVNAARAVSLAVAGTPPAADTTPPTVQIASPSTGANVSGLTTVDVSASDDRDIASVTIYADGTPVASDSAAPYSIVWDTRTLPNGQHRLQATACDNAGNANTAEANFNVSNPVPDTTPPSVAITSPTGGSLVGSTLTVCVNTTDNVRVTKVEMYVDGARTATSTSAPFTTKWSTRKLAKGTHSLRCRAYDAAGNATDSVAETVYK